MKKFLTFAGVGLLGIAAYRFLRISTPGVLPNPNPPSTETQSQGPTPTGPVLQTFQPAPNPLSLVTNFIDQTVARIAAAVQGNPPPDANSGEKVTGLNPRPSEGIGATVRPLGGRRPIGRAFTVNPASGNEVSIRGVIGRVR